MSYSHFFDDAILRLKGERRYRVFADIERTRRHFRARCGTDPSASKKS